MIYNVGKKKVLACLKDGMARLPGGELRDEYVEELLMKKIQEVHLNVLSSRYTRPFLLVQRERVGEGEGGLEGTTPGAAEGGLSGHSQRKV